jgi:SAM-dependent methyltransferase
VELVESGRIKFGNALDLCCGVGTNPIYLAKKGFNVVALDISDKAVEYAKNKADEDGVDIDLLVADYLGLPLAREKFDFVFDFGCFHHIKPRNRDRFIKGVHRVLKPQAIYFMVCFSYKNGSGWNHFTKEQIIKLFKSLFKIEWVNHVSSIEGDGANRYFYEVFMHRS